MKFKYIFILFLSCSLKDVNFHYEYYDNGNIKTEVSKIAGKLDGFSKYYDENENLINRVAYSQNLLHGTWEEFYVDGTLKYKANYLFGNKDGPEYWYHKNGNVKSETLYENGLVVYETLRWDASGNIIYK